MKMGEGGDVRAGRSARASRGENGVGGVSQSCAATANGCAAARENKRGVAAYALACGGVARRRRAKAAAAHQVRHGRAARRIGRAWRRAAAAPAALLLAPLRCAIFG